MNDTATTLTGGKHGTKWIGGIIMAAGSVAAADPALVTSVLTSIAGARGPGLAMVLLGAAALIRGGVNTKNSQTN